jgi:hypothetical protein
VRHSRLLRRLPNAARNFIHDDVVMRRVAAQQTANTNNRIVFFRFGERARGDWNFECPGNSNKRYIFFLGPGPQQPIVRALKKSLGNKRIETRDDKSKPPARRAQAASNGRNRWLGRTFDFYFSSRFSLRNSASRRWIGFTSP